MGIKHVKVVCATCFPDDACKEVGTNEWNDDHTIDGTVNFNNNCAINIKSIEFQCVGCFFCCCTPLTSPSITTSGGIFCPCFGTDITINVCGCAAVHIKAGTKEMTFNSCFNGLLDLNGARIGGIGQICFTGGGITSGCGNLRISSNACGTLDLKCKVVIRCELNLLCNNIINVGDVELDSLTKCGTGGIQVNDSFIMNGNAISSAGSISATGICIPFLTSTADPAVILGTNTDFTVGCCATKLLGEVRFNLLCGTTDSYATIQGFTTKKTGGQERGRLVFQAMKCGSFNDYLTIDGFKDDVEVGGVGLVFPSFTDCTRPAPCSVSAGTTIFNTSDGGNNVSDGTNWRGPSACGGWANT